MARLDKLPIASQIQDEAADWIARRDEEGLSEEQQRAFEAWLSASPAHKAAYDRYENIWGKFDTVVRELPKSVVEPARTNDRWTVRRWAMAAAAAALVAGSSVFVGMRLSSLPTYETAVGEQRTVLLEDGSRVTLNTDTRFTADFNPEGRIIKLGHGEALFEVAHDAARPFIVQSPYGSVRAIGTKFVVRIDSGDKLAVLVTEGKVLVARPNGADHLDGSQPSGTPVAAGQQANAVGREIAVASVAQARVGQELAWRQGDVVFNGERLSQAAAEMQRYTTTRITVDPAVAHFTVGGYFPTNDLDAFLQTVDSVFPVKILKTDGKVDIISDAS